MNTIKIEGETIVERNGWLRHLLSKGVYDVTFTKVNGESRTMPCTLKSTLLPKHEIKENAKTREPKLDNLSVWCVDKQEWRSFKVMNVTEVRELHAL